MPIGFNFDLGFLDPGGTKAGVREEREALGGGAEVRRGGSVGAPSREGASRRGQCPAGYHCANFQFITQRIELMTF